MFLSACSSPEASSIESPITSEEAPDSSLNQIARHDDISEEDSNFEISYSFSAHKSYIIGIRGGTDDASGLAGLSIQTDSESIYPISTQAGRSPSDEYVYQSFGYPIYPLPDPIKRGYTFVGWFYADGRQYQEGDMVDVIYWITLYAHWEEIEA